MRAAVVYNPVKIDLDAVRAVVEREEAAAGWEPTLWFETSREDPGRGPTLEAVEAGVDLVIAAGGDGTVRLVAETLAEHGTTLALLPSGTGNLLARNMDLTLDDVEHSLHTAFNGRNRPIDLGHIEIRRTDGTVDEHSFLVMAGLGIDAEMLAATDEELKAKVGWLAYVKAIATALRATNTSRLQYRLDDGPLKRLRAHTVIVGNCGTLTGNILLLPDAALDDGLFDVLLLSPEGIGHWLQILGKVFIENGIIRRTPLKHLVGRRHVEALNYVTAQTVSVTLAEAQQIELDGDHLGRATGFRTRVRPGAITIRVPADS
ncbi:diacylglycerol/lipid kinase family protein [Kineococcus rubinsiae]|uniref:diacylglycerol/lipid kinase family protein n=1 Tax=Kineococcus rubinsiae TaxID=2609562 RepID=UPI0014317235|nr:diacylglycerol kinase family protein [Kineococcus rubinsiae]NIZ89671.1 diacylglycerol kinase family lipid kinase [Kineococcus rubinsiae]